MFILIAVSPMDISQHKDGKKLTLWQKFVKMILTWLRLTDDYVLKVYHGYGNASEMLLFGHVFSLSPLPRKKYRKNFWTNTLALLRSFMVWRVADAVVTVEWEDQLVHSTTAKDGFFRLDWKTKNPAKPGLHTVQVQLRKSPAKDASIIATAPGYIVVPHANQYAFVSDIDDTFLVSHSSTVFKKLYVLFTKNAHSRKPFEGVVKHYQLLASAQAEDDEPNAFFYVSSSEWNLYDFIKEFTRKNKMPEGVYLLSQVKRLHEVFKSGANKHSTKFMRIARVLEAYPQQQFILLGDDSQMDPVIYASIVEHFPGRVVSVYLRHVYKKNISNVRELVKKIEGYGVACCHFVHSKEAIQHSIRLGFISEAEFNAYK
jgi:phosphatidate phosphatase APP1